MNPTDPIGSTEPDFEDVFGEADDYPDDTTPDPSDGPKSPRGAAQPSVGSPFAAEDDANPFAISGGPEQPPGGDVDLSFAAAVLHGGRVAVREAASRGVTLERLQGDGRKVYEFTLDYLGAHGATPTVDLVLAKTGVVVPDAPPTAPPAYWAGEILGRQLFAEMQGGMGRWTSLLERRKVYDAFEDITAWVRTQSALYAPVTTAPLFSHLDAVKARYLRRKRGEYGVQTPWPTINRLTCGIDPEQVWLLVARSGVGKCVEASTEVVDPVTGVPRTVESIYADPGVTRTLTWGKPNGIHATAITAKVDTGRKRCLRFTFASGRSITVTPEHPLLTAEGWREAATLAPGETVAVPAHIPSPESPVDLSAEVVDILAVLLAEGSYTGNHVGFSSADPVVVARMTAAASSLGVRVAHRSRYDYDFVRIGTSGSNAVRELLRELGADKTLAKHKVAPEALFRLPMPSLARFLGLFWMCDGYVDATGPGVTLASERLVRQIQHLLLRFGVQSSVSARTSRCEGKTFPSWRLRVYSHTLPAFQKALGPFMWGEKARRVSAMVARTRNPNVGYPTVSQAFRDRIRALSESRSGRWAGGAHAAVAERIGKGRPFETRQMFGPSGTLRLPVFRAFCEVYGIDAENQWLWSADIYWDRIQSIEDAGDCRIFDLTVEPTSCFVANDVIVHNTWGMLVMAHCAWRAGHRVLFATTEMSQEEIVRRFVAVHLALPYGLFTSGRLPSAMEQAFFEACDLLQQDDSIHLVGGDFDFKPESYEAAIEKTRPVVSFLDGAYLLKMPGKSRVDQAAEAFNEVKRIGKRQKIGQVLSSQFNRDAKAEEGAKAATQEKVALSDAAVWNSTVIMALGQTKDMRRDRIATARLVKNREGPLGEVLNFNWDFDAMDFSEQIPDLAGEANADPFDTGIGPVPEGEVQGPSPEDEAASIF